MAEQILSLMPFSEAQKRRLERLAPGSGIVYGTRESVTEEQVRQADIILGNPPVCMLRHAGRLKWLQLQSAGADAYLTDNILRPETLLTTARGAYGPAVSEHMLAMLLALFKKLHLYWGNQQKGCWQDEGNVRSICGSTVLIVGLGDIGCAFAERIHALGGTVIGIKRRLTAKPSYVDELAAVSEMRNKLPYADVVANVLPATPETARLFNRELFGLMKPGAVFINAGRGSTVDHNALADALYAGHLSGACLDVTEPEPLPCGHILWKAPNLLITPHSAGGTHLPETFFRVAEIVFDNLTSYRERKALRNVVHGLDSGGIK